ncbi:MAG: metallophosphoesterase [Clostridiales bacterium]|nr:metallophosphoesterase [Candidatus Cacconaster stercorequi]
MSKRTHRRAVWWLPAAVLLILFVIWQNNALSVEEYPFVSSHLPQGWNGGRIAVVSDLHGKQFGANNETLLRALSEVQPDIIAITGDLCDSRSGDDFVPDLLSALQSIAPTYYVTGNHEWAAGLMPALREMLDEADVVYLRNTWQTVTRSGDDLILAGVDDPNGYADQPTPQEVADTVPEGAFWLLLAHRNNEYPTYGALGADLIISGHAHGGLVRLPGTDGLFGPGAEWMPRWTNGFYADYPSPMFTSRGLGNSVLIPRIFDRPELAVITLKAE